MSTNARVGLELKDGQILSIYSHWDGYPEWLGVKLNEHFNSREKASELIDGGDCSVVWTDDRWATPEEREMTRSHLIKKGYFGPQYYSERGEDCPPRLSNNLKEYLQDSEEYSYVFNRLGEWICYRHDWDTETAVLTEIPASDK